MHLQIYSAVILPSQTALASLQFGKHNLEKTRMLRKVHGMVCNSGLSLPRTKHA